MKIVLAVATLAALAALYYILNEPAIGPDDEFIDYIAYYKKSYPSTQEFKFRFKQFTKALLKIKELNANPEDEAVYEINHMADWTEAEHKGILGAVPVEDKNVEVKSFTPQGGDVDWRETDHLTPVKDQAACGSCWAFAATETIEAAHSIAHDHELFDLSEQELVDCSRSFGN